MKLNKIILVSILLLAIISLGAVNAQDNLTLDIIEEQNSEDLNSISEVNYDINEDINIDGGKLGTSDEDVVGDITADNVTVEVSNVFVGQNASISVMVPEATGTVNIIVNGKIYAPEFIGGMATQNISNYSIGLNNVTVKYNDIVKETSFKVLDGVVTDETFEDYFEYSSGISKTKIAWSSYDLYSYIPEGAVLDFRGFINIPTTTLGTSASRNGLTIISSTKDAVINGSIGVTGFNSAISDINISGGILLYDKASLTNSHIGKLSVIVSSFADFSIVNVTVDNTVSIRCYTNKDDDIFLISNSTLLGGLISDNAAGLHNFVLKDSIIVGNITCFLMADGIIENNIIYGSICPINSGYMHNFTIRNNTIYYDGSYYAMAVNGDSHFIVNNTVYNYGNDYAIRVSKNSTVVNNRLFSNNFGDNAVKLIDYAKDVIIENNAPNNISLTVKTNIEKIIYDENITIDVNANADGMVNLDVNGKKYDLKLINGNASLTINEYHSGTNKIAVYYADVLNDIYGYDDTTFYVYKVTECPIELVCENATADRFFTVNVVLPDDANGTITFTVNNDTHSITIKQYADGRNNIINLLALSEGNYTMSATFESDKYITNSTCTYIQLVHEPVYDLTAGDVVMDYKDGSKYKVLLTKDGKAIVGEIVKITFNGKTSDVKTDEGGYATLTLDASPNTYTIKSVYNGITKSSKATIKNILKASNLSKKKAKTIKFSTTLKTSKGKVITGKKITFKLKGKTYTAKTNKKGIATISLKNLKVGKYTITSKYGECTVKNTITIKK